MLPIIESSVTTTTTWRGGTKGPYDCDADGYRYTVGCQGSVSIVLDADEGAGSKYLGLHEVSFRDGWDPASFECRELGISLGWAE